MSSLFGLLHVGASGVQAHGVGLSSTAHNVENADTPGYTRRRVRLEPLPPPPQGGGGVVARGTTRILDRYVEARLLGATSARAEAETRAFQLGVLDRVLTEADGGVAHALDDMEGALRELSARPGDLAVRRSVLGAVDRLARAFVGAAEQLDGARAEIDARLADEVDALRGRLQSIGGLNQQIRRAEVNGEEAGDLRDRRDALVREVAEQVPVRVVEGANGPSLLLDGGLSLVDAEGTVASLSVARDATGALQVMRTTAGLEQSVSAAIDGGRIGGLLAARDGALAEARTRLDTLALDVATAYDAVHAAGVGLDGTGGRRLFGSPMTGAADMALSPELVGRPDRLAAAVDPAATAGDNRNALALVGLADRALASGGTETAQRALAALVGLGGQAVESALRDIELTSGSEAQLENVRGSISGVSVEEEMIALTRYQRGYQASLQIVKVADDMLQELLSMVR